MDNGHHHHHSALVSQYWLSQLWLFREGAIFLFAEHMKYKTVLWKLVNFDWFYNTYEMFEQLAQFLFLSVMLKGIDKEKSNKN